MLPSTSSVAAVTRARSSRCAGACWTRQGASDARRIVPALARSVAAGWRARRLDRARARRHARFRIRHARAPVRVSECARSWREVATCAKPASSSRAARRRGDRSRLGFAPAMAATRARRSSTPRSMPFATPRREHPRPTYWPARAPFLPRAAAEIRGLGGRPSHGQHLCFVARQE